MRFEPNDDQREIQRTARAVLQSGSAMRDVRRAAESGHYDTKLWAELVELGWPGITVSERYGGIGLGTVELALICEELGYACAPVPMLGTLLAACALTHAGSEAQRERWLPQLVSGAAKGTVGCRTGGETLLVDGADADVVIVVDQERGCARLIERAEADLKPVAMIDQARSWALCRGGVGEPMAGGLGAAAGQLQVALAAELTGVSQRALDMTLEYIREREQFGTPVGAFQAVAHRAAQMLRDTESARVMTYHGAWAVDRYAVDPGLAGIAAAMAKAAAADAARATTAAAVQLHGGVGFTWEADVHWLLKRAQLDATLLGSASSQRIELARAPAVRAHKR